MSCLWGKFTKWRYLPLKSYFLCVAWPTKMVDSDIPEDSKTLQVIKSDMTKNEETGRDRLYLMYSLDEFGNFSKELDSAYQAGLYGIFFGVMYGGFVHSRVAYMDFIQQNQASVYKNHYDAKKSLQDRVTVNFAKGAFRWGWRLGLFSGSYVLVSTTISVYRGKSSLWEYIISGGVVGSFYKMNLGVRGMLVGGLLGSVLGTVAGAISLALLMATGMTMEEMRYWQNSWKMKRTEQELAYVKATKVHKEDMPLLKAHDAKGGPEMVTLESIGGDKANK